MEKKNLVLYYIIYLDEEAMKTKRVRARSGNKPQRRAGLRRSSLRSRRKDVKGRKKVRRTQCKSRGKKWGGMTKRNLQTAISYDAAINNNKKNDHGHGITRPTRGVIPLSETDLWRIWGENNYKNKELNDSFGTMHIGKKYDD